MSIVKVLGVFVSMFMGGLFYLLTLIGPVAMYAYALNDMTPLMKVMLFAGAGGWFVASTFLYGILIWINVRGLFAKEPAT